MTLSRVNRVADDTLRIGTGPEQTRERASVSADQQIGTGPEQTRERASVSADQQTASSQS